MSKGGRPSQLSLEHFAELRKSLLARPIGDGYATDAWTLKRLRLLIERRVVVSYSDAHVWCILGAMGLLRQKPEKRAIEGYEQAVPHWKKRALPAIKNTKPAMRTV